MLAFSRLSSILLFVLSLSFLTCALPSPTPSSHQALAARGTGNDVLDLILGLKVKVEDHCDKLAVVKVFAQVEAAVGPLVADIDACAKAVVAIGNDIKVDASVKAEIAVHVAAIIAIIVKVCVSIVAKFGILVCLTILAKIDVCLKLLLSNLNVCVGGIIVLIAELVVKIGVEVLVNIKLTLCLGVLGLLKL